MDKYHYIVIVGKKKQIYKRRVYAVIIQAVVVFNVLQKLSVFCHCIFIDNTNRTYNMTTLCYL